MSGSNKADWAASWKSQRRQSSWRAVALVAPLLIVVSLLLVWPLFGMVSQSVWDPTFKQTLPLTTKALREWDGVGPIRDPLLVQTLIDEVDDAQQQRRLGDVIRRLDFEEPGAGAVLARTARLISQSDPDRAIELNAGAGVGALDRLRAIDERWGEIELWQLLARCSEPWTLTYWLRAWDYRISPDGSWRLANEGVRPHTSLFVQTFLIAAVITMLSLSLAFVLAGYLASVPAGSAKWLLLLILLPMWVSLLVRATAWITLLQTQGVINDLLVFSGLIGEDQRLPMIYNLTGTVVVMTHYMLPTMVLPIYAAMRMVPRSLLRAGLSLGASPIQVFWRVYFPHTIPGVAVAGLLGFITALGFYVIPALVGGASGQLISSAIANYTYKSMNYGLASAIGSSVLLAVGGLFWVYLRFRRLAPDASGASTDLGLALPGISLLPATATLSWFRRLHALVSWVLIVWLILPLLVVIPISFSAEPLFSFTAGMLAGDPQAWSLRWYRDLFAEPRWQTAFFNSVWVAITAATLALGLSIIAAVGLSRRELPMRRAVEAVLLVPSVAPIVLLATGIFFLYSSWGLLGTMTGVVIAHMALIAPSTAFLLQAALTGVPVNFDRAAASLGAPVLHRFFEITFPMVIPAFIGAFVMAFLGSFDEPVVVQFITFSPAQFTFPKQMFAGIQDEMTPVILAASTLMLGLCVLVFFIVEMSRWVVRRRPFNQSTS